MLFCLKLLDNQQSDGDAEFRPDIARTRAKRMRMRTQFNQVAIKYSL